MTHVPGAVQDVLVAQRRFLTAAEVQAALATRGQAAATSSVYRVLTRLADAGQVDKVLGEDGQTRYRACVADDHHHHLLCRSCGATEELVHPDLEAWAQRTAAEHGFALETDVLELIGLCRSCRR
ncbi:MAG: Fur family transcriptional regulator [Actinomycetales bacterium]